MMGLWGLGIALTATTTVFAKDYYVAPSGSNTDCTQTVPCSLTTGLDMGSQPGDEVILLDGVYPETFVTRHNGTQTQYITIRAQNTRQAIFRPSGVTLAHIKHSYLIIRGIHFDGQKKAGTQGGIKFAGPEVSTPPHHIIFEDNVVEKTYASGVHLTYGQHDIIIRNNFINGTGYGAYWGEGFYIGHKTDATKSVYNVEIYGNDIRDFTENGLETKQYSYNIVVRNNIFRDQVVVQDHGVTPPEGRGNNGTIEIGGHSNKVYNNIVYNCKGGMASLVVKPNAGHKIYNNVVYNSVEPTKSAIRMQDWGTQWPKGAHPPSEIYNNTFYNMTNYGGQGIDPSGLMIRNNLGINLPDNLTQAQISSTNFVDAARGNFRLTPKSLAIDRALQSPYSSSDFDGRSIVGSKRDFGAFEAELGILPPSGLRVEDKK